MLIRLDTVNVCDEGLLANEELCMFDTVSSDRRCGSIDHVGGNGLVASKNVQSWEWRLVCLWNIGARDKVTLVVLGCRLKCLLNGVQWCIEKLVPVISILDVTSIEFHRS